MRNNNLNVNPLNMLLLIKMLKIIFTKLTFILKTQFQISLVILIKLIHYMRMLKRKIFYSRNVKIVLTKCRKDFEFQKNNNNNTINQQKKKLKKEPIARYQATQIKYMIQENKLSVTVKKLILLYTKKKLLIHSQILNHKAKMRKRAQNLEMVSKTQSK